MDSITLYYSSASIEKYWRAMSRLSANSTDYTLNEKMKERISYDDQVRLNYALLMLNPVWEKRTREKTQDKLKRATTASGFTVTLLLNSIVCRVKCEKELQSKYYLWHQHAGSKDSKSKKADKADLWFLRRNWESITTTATREQWLKEISKLT